VFTKDNTNQPVLPLTTCIVFPRWERFIPRLGIFYSQGGNKKYNKERVLLNKGWLLNNKGWLLENKRRLSLDLTWFLGKVPK
jgi:hypothetical protein